MSASCLQLAAPRSRSIWWEGVNVNHWSKKSSLKAKKEIEVVSSPFLVDLLFIFKGSSKNYINSKR